MLRAGAAALLLMAGAGCVARATGDFGRAPPSFTHDTAMPAVGKLVAYARDEPVSNFNQTDEETEMHDRVWRFLIAEHTSSWFYNTAVELQRTRIISAVDDRFSSALYFDWLKQTDYRSSPVRYATVGADILADTDTLPATFTAICKVIEIDRQRAIARDGLPNIEPDVKAGVDARKSENDAHIAWFVRALNYRYDSYNYALDHLLIETPHQQSIDVDHKLGVMQGFVGQANRGDFCSGPSATGMASGGRSIPSRYQTQKIDNEVIAIK